MFMHVCFQLSYQLNIKGAAKHSHVSKSSKCDTIFSHQDQEGTLWTNGTEYKLNDGRTEHATAS